MITSSKQKRWIFVSLILLLSAMVFSALVLMNFIVQDIVWFQRYYNNLLLFTSFGIAIFLLIICSNLWRLYRQLKNKSMGARLTWRMVKMIAFIVILPPVLFYLFSFYAINRNIDDLHTVEIERTIQDTIDLSNASIDAALLAYKRRTKLLADDIFLAQISKENPIRLLNNLRLRADAYELTLYTNGGSVIGMSSQDSFRLLPTRLRKKIEKDSVSIRQIKDLGSYIEVLMPVTISGNYRKPNVLLALYPISERIGILKARIKEAKSLYQRQDFIKEPLKRTVITNITLVLFFALLLAFWIAFRMVNKLVQPLAALSQATKAVAQGDYKVKVSQTSDDDLGDLTALFNQMTVQINNGQYQQEKAQQQLSSQKVYLETILKYSYGVIALDKAKNIQLINQVCQQILDLNSKNILKTHYQKLLERQKELLPLINIIDLYFEQKQSEWRQQVHLRINQRHLTIECQFARLMDKNSNLGVVIVLNDVSKLRSAERQSAWAEVAKRLAHEIKNPLTPIQLSAERLRKKYLKTMPSQDSEVLDKTTNTIMQQVASLKKMVSEFAEYAKTPKPDKKIASLNAIIAHTLMLYDEETFIHFEPADNLPKLALDNDQIRSLLINLIKNALEACQQKTNPKIDVRTILKKTAVHLEVSDNGEGFSATVMENLFEPYVTTKHKGTGLGLAIIKRIVEEHQAEIKIENNQPNGAKVTIIFPV